MDPKLEIEYLESDPSKIWVTANNSVFAGGMDVYINENTLRTLAAELEEFPRSSNAEIVYEAGSEESPYGYCGLRFYCFDSAGHTAVIVKLINEIASNVPDDNRCQVVMKLQFEAISLDSFKNSLIHALKAGKGKATLRGIYAYTQNI